MLSALSGVLLVVVPRRLGRAYGLPSRAGVLRLLGARDIAIGLMTARDGRAGLSLRAVSDLADAALILRGAPRGRRLRRETSARAAIAIASASLALCVAWREPRLAPRGG